jgi:hypothetical protein
LQQEIDSTRAMDDDADDAWRLLNIYLSCVCHFVSNFMRSMNGGDQKAIERCQQYQRYECSKGRCQNIKYFFVQIIFAKVRLIRINITHLRKV